MNKKLGFWSAAAAALFITASAHAAGTEYLVKLKASTMSEEVSLLSRSGLEVIQRFPEINVIHVRVADKNLFRTHGPLLAAKAEYVANNGTVHIVEAAGATTPNDPYWKRDQRRFRELDLEKAWEVTTGSKEVIVGVSDTGVSQKHPDLINQLGSVLNFV